MKSKKLVEGAIYIALSVLLTRFFTIKISIYGVEGVRIGIGVLPIIFAGLRNGIVEGAKVGALADIAGYLMSPGGPYMPHFTLTSALNGALPPLLMGTKRKFNLVRIFFAIGITQLITGMVIVPYFLLILFGIPYQLIFLPRLISVVLNMIIINFVLVVLDKRINIFNSYNSLGSHRSS